jgi:hypothetical protein
LCHGCQRPKERIDIQLRAYPDLLLGVAEVIEGYLPYGAEQAERLKGMAADLEHMATEAHRQWMLRGGA